MNGVYTVNEIQLSYKYHTNPAALPVVICAEDAYHILITAWDENRLELVEDFQLLLLSRASKVLGVYQVSSGSTAGTLADPKLIFVTALKTNAHSIILAHNHPSGNLQPSRQDRDFTDRMKKAGEFLEINVHDNLIVTPHGYHSLANDLTYLKVQYGKTFSFECQPPF